MIHKCSDAYSHLPEGPQCPSGRLLCLTHSKLVGSTANSVFPPFFIQYFADAILKTFNGTPIVASFGYSKSESAFQNESDPTLG